MATLRRSPRLAAKITTTVTDDTPIHTPSSRKTKSIKKNVSVPKTMEWRTLTPDELAADLALYEQMLIQATHIRNLIVNAITNEDFINCYQVVKTLSDTTDNLLSCGSDEMFITDCLSDCRQAFLNPERRDTAITAIDYYIKSLNRKIITPPLAIYDHIRRNI